jgi:hypothetical protein
MIGHTKVPGPLAVFADGFRAELERLGYTPSSREFKLAEVAKLSAWLEAVGWVPGISARPGSRSSSLTWQRGRDARRRWRP